MKYKFLFFSGLFLLLVLAVVGCQSPKPLPGEIVARVGDQYLTRTQVMLLVPSSLEEDTKEQYMRNIIDRWVELQVLAKAAESEGIELTELQRFELEKMRLEMLATRYIQNKLSGDVLITDEEIEEYYQQNQKEFVRDADEVHLVHLFLEKLDRAIVNEIRQSKELLAVIEKNYLDRQITTMREKNGDLGYVQVQDLRPEIRKTVRFARTGRIYGPIKSSDGYHYIQVLDKKKAGTIRSLELVRSGIELRLKMEKREEALKALKVALKKQFDVETFLTNIN